MKVLVVVEDDPDVQLLIEAIFSMDSRFTIAQVTESAEEALAAAQTSDPGVIVLDQDLAGELSGLDAAPLFKAVAPRAKIILFTAHAQLKARAEQEPAIDGFVVKTESAALLTMAQRLTGLDTRLG